MRRIGTLNDPKLAERFCDYLLTRSIDCSYDCRDQDGDRHDQDGKTGGNQSASSRPCDIWIRDESDVETAREEFQRFQASPDAETYDVPDQAARIRREEAARIARKKKNQRDARRVMKSRPSAAAMLGGVARQQAIPVTIAFVVAAVVIGFATNMGNPKPSSRFEQGVFHSLSFVDYRLYSATGDGFASIRRGQIWRFFTPMLLHGGAMHLAFNMIMLYMLGSALERLHGSFWYLVLILASQLAGMLLQVSLPDWLPAPLQGSFLVVGASGVVYGLFGFLWFRPRFDPSYPIQVPPSSVAVLVGWLLLCMTPIVPNIANGAHFGGLVAGIALAYVVPRTI